MTPNEQTTEVEATVVEKQEDEQPVAAVATSSIGTKDLLIPISIAIAGAFIGIGLFFGGTSGGSQLAQNNGGANPAAPAEPSDTTDQVLPVSEDDWIKGDPDAPIVVIEYSDFDCPFCSGFHSTMNQVVEESNGQVAWVYRHFPLEQLHPQAAAVALAAECVGAQGGADAFWQFTDNYFEVRGNRDATPHSVLIPQLVTETGVAQEAFTDCFESGVYGDKIRSHIENAVATGGRGTPWSVVIGPDGETYSLNGAQPKESVEQLINFILQDA